MDIQQIELIKQAWRDGMSHKQIKEKFGLFYSQEYAINILGRDYRLSSVYLSEYIDNVKDGMKTGEIAKALNLTLND